MNDAVPITCHVIIGHPSKPKFLVVDHEEGWAPPILIHPPGPVDYLAPDLNEGMRKKYGLTTRMLRPLLELKNYQCVEMELIPPARRRLKAVWVGSEEYERFTMVPEGQVDPFRAWLKRAESANPSEGLPPWSRRGWFDQADVWIRGALEEQQIPVTGSVQQFRAGWDGSCILRIPVRTGSLFFKAGRDAPPREAEITQKLSDWWPDLVAAPLAVRARSNWMINRDLEVDGAHRARPAELPDCARRMAELQIDSAGKLAELEALGVKQVDSQAWLSMCEPGQRMMDFLAGGRRGLSPAEIDQFREAACSLKDHVKRLYGAPVPPLLVHRDFRDDNLLVSSESLRIIDWADPVITHPFLVLDRIHVDHTAIRHGLPRSAAQMSVDDALLVEIRQAYLAPFSHIGTVEELSPLLDAASRLSILWLMQRFLGLLDHTPSESANYPFRLDSLQALARLGMQAWSAT